MRVGDRPYEVGHVLWLRRWDPHTGCYTGAGAMVVVTHIAKGPLFGLHEDFVCMSIRLRNDHDSEFYLAELTRLELERRG